MPHPVTAVDMAHQFTAGVQLDRCRKKRAGAILFQSYPNTLVGFGIWSILMRKYPASTIAPFALLVPVTGMLSATLLLDKPMHWWKSIAGILVLRGLGVNLFGARAGRWLKMQLAG